MIIKVRVIPNSKVTEIVGRLGSILRVKLASPNIENKANIPDNLTGDPACVKWNEDNKGHLIRIWGGKKYDSKGRVLGYKTLIDGIPKEKKVTIPVLGILPATTAAIQSVEAIKILLGHEPNGLMFYNIWTQQFDTILIKKNPQCTCCVEHKMTYL